MELLVSHDPRILEDSSLLGVLLNRAIKFNKLILWIKVEHPLNKVLIYYIHPEYRDIVERYWIRFHMKANLNKLFKGKPVG